MALDVYFRDDIANIIRSVNQSGGNTAAIVHYFIAECERNGVHPDMHELEKKLNIYQRGFCDALGAVAVAFGILPE